MLRPRRHPLAFDAEGLKLSGVLHLPGREPSAVVVGCHGLMADKNSPKQLALADGCTAIGLAYFRFDHRGCGQSEGRFEVDTTLENRKSDLIAAVYAVHKALGLGMPLGLFGSSLGGTVCLTAASTLAPMATVTLAAPVHSRSIRIPDNSPESLKKEIFRNRLAFNISAAIGSIGHILIIHGSDDETVPVENAHTIFRLAADPKRELIVPGGDHRISQKSHQEHFIQAAVQWYADCFQSR
jgi:uncharacterized protein